MTSLEDLKNKLRERARQGKPGTWLFAPRMDRIALAPARISNQTGSRCRRSSGGRWCCNGPMATRWSSTHLALKRAGIDRNTPDPKGRPTDGRYVRNTPEALFPLLDSRSRQPAHGC
jgi:hypothetical protein